MYLDFKLFRGKLLVLFKLVDLSIKKYTSIRQKHSTIGHDQFLVTTPAVDESSHMVVNSYPCGIPSRILREAIIAPHQCIWLASQAKTGITYAS